jgi:hypothetical protein
VTSHPLRWGHAAIIDFHGIVWTVKVEGEVMPNFTVIGYKLGVSGETATLVGILAALVIAGIAAFAAL